MKFDATAFKSFIKETKEKEMKERGLITPFDTPILKLDKIGMKDLEHIWYFLGKLYLISIF